MCVCSAGFALPDDAKMFSSAQFCRHMCSKSLYVLPNVMLAAPASIEKILDLEKNVEQTNASWFSFSMNMDTIHLCKRTQTLRFKTSLFIEMGSCLCSYRTLSRNASVSFPRADINGPGPVKRIKLTPWMYHRLLVDLFFSGSSF